MDGRDSSEISSMGGLLSTGSIPCEADTAGPKLDIQTSTQLRRPLPRPAGVVREP